LTLSLRAEDFFNLELASRLTGESKGGIIARTLAPVLVGARKRAEAEFGIDQVEAAWLEWIERLSDK
jgi:hypothetical protein